jgi:hypothetical protein
VNADRAVGPCLITSRTPWEEACLRCRNTGEAAHSSEEIHHEAMCGPVTAQPAVPVTRLAPTDAAIIKASLRDPAQFAAVFDRHANEIFRYAAGRLGTDAADDVTAETLCLVRLFPT